MCVIESNARPQRVNERHLAPAAAVHVIKTERLTHRSAGREIEHPARLDVIGKKVVEIRLNSIPIEERQSSEVRQRAKLFRVKAYRVEQTPVIRNVGGAVPQHNPKLRNLIIDQPGFIPGLRFLQQFQCA